MLQIPDLVLLGALLAFAQHWDWISTRAAWVAFGVWLLKDVLMYPLIGPVLVRRPLLGPERLIGQTAIVVRDLDPEGLVRIQGELWRARSANGPIPSGVYTEVLSMSGLTLRVRTKPEPERTLR